MSVDVPELADVEAPAVRLRDTGLRTGVPRMVRPTGRRAALELVSLESVAPLPLPRGVVPPRSGVMRLPRPDLPKELSPSAPSPAGVVAAVSSTGG